MKVHLIGLGRILFASSFVAAGALSIGMHGFAQAWQPLPKWIGAQALIATISSAVMLVGGLALMGLRTARVAALVLAAFLLLRILVLKIPVLAAHPLIEGAWEDMSESLIQIAGAWTIFSMLPRNDGTRANGNVPAGRILFALALPAIGLSHMIYLDQTAPLIPTWLPFHEPLAYFTGVAYIAAAVALLTGVLSRLAATLVALMVSLFTLLVWVPMVTAAPTNASDWSELCVSAAITGAAWAVAESYRDRSWTLALRTGSA